MKSVSRIVDSLIETIASKGLTRYEPGYWREFYGEAQLAPVLRAEWTREDFGGMSESWVAVCCLPTVAVKSAVCARDWVQALNGFARGNTCSGRAVYGHVAVVTGSNDGYFCRENDQVPAQELNRDAYVQDTWVVIVMEKDPRASSFATDPEVWGRAEWHIVHQPEVARGFPVGFVAQFESA